MLCRPQRPVSFAITDANHPILWQCFAGDLNVSRKGRSASYYMAQDWCDLMTRRLSDSTTEYVAFDRYELAVLCISMGAEQLSRAHLGMDLASLLVRKVKPHTDEVTSLKGSSLRPLRPPYADSSSIWSRGQDGT
jgi:hypothetical protein